MPGNDDFLSEKSIDDIQKMSSDMIFIAHFSVVYGLVLCIGVITAIVGLPLYLSGIRLKKAAYSLQKINSDKDIGNINDAFSSLKVFFKIHKLILIFAIILSALLIFGMLMTFIFLGLEIFK